MSEQYPFVLVVMGLPGSGKTFLAKRLAPVLNAVHISSDRVRKQEQRLGWYTSSDKQWIYQEMLVQATKLLQQEKSVVLDGTFHRRTYRQLVKDFAAIHRWPLFFVEMTAGEETIHQRVTKPRPDSEADYPVYQLLKQQYEPLQLPHLPLDSSRQSVEEMLGAVENYLTQ